ncbi:hypothetical protein [Streptomyces cacaoi]|uniref:hypothetical protein n=1 Tax=Streptomyces cacaoi TaxID=1898 RepID=UPI0037489F18
MGKDHSRTSITHYLNTIFDATEQFVSDVLDTAEDVESDVRHSLSRALDDRDDCRDDDRDDCRDDRRDDCRDEWDDWNDDWSAKGGRDSRKAPPAGGRTRSERPAEHRGTGGAGGRGGGGRPERGEAPRAEDGAEALGPELRRLKADLLELAERFDRLSRRRR